MSTVVYKNISELLTLEGVVKKNGSNLIKSDLGKRFNVSIVVKDDSIKWLGNAKHLPSEYINSKEVDCSNMVITPPLCDSHTHLVFGGDRSAEYVQKLNGADYQEIANAGGGILATMKATQQASEEVLYELASERVRRVISTGTKYLEIKTGYDLRIDGELKLLRIINKLKAEFEEEVFIHRTFMPAHAVPKGFNSSKDFMSKTVFPAIEKASGFFDSVDIFHEEGYFSTEDTETLFNFCQNNKLDFRIHADEFQDNNGASIASNYGALSADHLLCVSETGIEDLAKSKTIATLLPGTSLFLGKPFAPARKLLDAGCRVAIASDYNPGSCHYYNLFQIAQMTVKTMGFNEAEFWSSITYNALASIKKESDCEIKVGGRFNPTFFRAKSSSEVIYSWGENLIVNI